MAFSATVAGQPFHSFGFAHLAVAQVSPFETAPGTVPLDRQRANGTAVFSRFQI
jgi:hypothetical protein